ncbi:hypothetical protein FB45DRAFT_898164 [Roridomyces roridus]|uniref:F-box domain-containing protein n=1 Tax=Roridomyces roridus TaxID=1738132 RepID=A0AAD7CC13_9AGAR|nr:hypothetical protein FB45DRAFT_898164 [Roridomyces roridus]
MSELRSRLTEIERQMDLLDDQMALLRAEREAVARELGAIVYPVLTPLALPTEILSKIFLQYVRGHLLYNPLPLSWVCRLWRQVAICTHRLWTHFNIDKGSGSEELLQVVTAYSSQWDTLALDMALLPTNLCFSFPRLTKLDLITMSDGPSTLPTFTNSLRLRELRVQGYVLPVPSALQFTQLTNLNLDTDVDTCLEMLAHTPNVENLHISLESMERPTQASLPPISLPSLRTLELGIETCQIFPYITIPALEKLTLYIDKDDPPTMVTELADCIARSSCSIRMLELRSVPLAAVRAPTIDGLGVRPDDDVLSNLFTAVAGYSGFLPALEAFNIENLRCPDGCRPLFAILTDEMDKSQTADRVKLFQVFSEAVLEACDTAKNREQFQMETKLKTLPESSQVNDGSSSERILIALALRGLTSFFPDLE